MLVINILRDRKKIGASGINPKIESVRESDFSYSYHPIFKTVIGKKLKGMVPEERCSRNLPIKHYNRFKKLVETHDSLIDKAFDYESIKKILDEQTQLIVEFDLSFSD